ncbi:MAG: type II secretion system F family protein [Oscillospiraceae bacterium]|nr:type II secretion system F family protein [Oscillospiraceae bacterium]
MPAAVILTIVWFICENIFKSRLPGPEYVELLGDYKLKGVMRLPIAFLLALRYRPRISYDRKILVHIIEYYGKSDSNTRFILHQASKLASMAIAIELSLIVGAFTAIDQGYLIFCTMMVGAMFFLPDSMLNNSIKKRRLEIMLDFPDFIVRLTLLINAGMTVTKAWEKVSADLGGKRALGRELEIAGVEINSGKSAFKAYEDFAKRCRTQEVTRVVSVLLQNIKKGNSELVSVLRIHANECWEMRKNAARKLGEEASSKMLFPVFLMFISIILIVTTPAILAMQSFY